MTPEELERIGKYAARLARSAGYVFVLDPEERQEMRELMRKWAVENGMRDPDEVEQEQIGDE